jgi:hypothetical protein
MDIIVLLHQVLFDYIQITVFLDIDFIPCWFVDDQDEMNNWENTHIKVYSRLDSQRMKIQDVVSSARDGRVDYGIKGTRHVAVIGTLELPLEFVTPRVKWGQWISGGKDFNENGHPVLYESD